MVIRIIAAIFSGAILAVISPPLNLHYLHWFSYVPLFLALNGSSAKRGFFLGYLCGLVGVFLLFFWLTETVVRFSELSYALSLGVTFLFAAIWGLPYGVLGAVLPLLQKRFHRSWVVLFPSFWVAVELMTPALFPYYQGLSQYQVVWTWQLASVFGAYGLSFLIIFSNATVTEIILSRLEKRAFPRFSFAAAVLLITANFVFCFYRYHGVEAKLRDAPRINIGLVQVKNTMQERLALSAEKNFDLLTRQSERIGRKKMDLLVWPEGALPYSPQDQRTRVGIALLTEWGGFPLFVGGGKTAKAAGTSPKKSQRNSGYLFSPLGEVMASYDKMILLPFGEYWPQPLQFLRDKIHRLTDLEAGKKASVFTVAGFKFTTPICYEAILESQIRRLLDGDFLLNITDDGWFGDTAAPYQHAMLAAAAAMEFGVPLVRSAYNGINMLVEPHGVIRYETKPFTDAAAIVTVPKIALETPYKTWGRYFPHSCLILSLMSVGILFFQNENSQNEDGFLGKWR